MAPQRLTFREIVSRGVRQKRNEAALGEWRQAASQGASQAHCAYVYAVGLHSAGRRDNALAVLRDSLQIHPNDHDALSAALALSRDRGESASVLGYAEHLLRPMRGN